MDNEIENRTKNKTQHISNWTWRSGQTSRECDWTSRNIKLHNWIRKKSNQTTFIWWIRNSEDGHDKRRMLYVTILFHHLAWVGVIHFSCLKIPLREYSLITNKHNQKLINILENQKIYGGFLKILIFRVSLSRTHFPFSGFTFHEPVRKFCAYVVTLSYHTTSLFCSQTNSVPFISSTIARLIHFIDHSPSLPYLPYLIILMLHCHSALLSQYIKETGFRWNTFLHQSLISWT